MSTPRDRLTRNYTPTFLTFLGHPDEEALHSAYELGRAALADNITLLDLVRTHHQVFGQILSTTPNPDDLPAIINAAADFLVEAFVPYEIAPPRLSGNHHEPMTSPGEPPHPTTDTTPHRRAPTTSGESRAAAESHRSPRTLEMARRGLLGTTAPRVCGDVVSDRRSPAR